MDTRLTLCDIIVCRIACPYYYRLFRWPVLHPFLAVAVLIVLNAIGVEGTPHVLCRTGLYHHPANH